MTRSPRPACRRHRVVGLLLLLTACGGESAPPTASAPTPTPVPGTLAIAVAPATLTVTQGQSGTATITVTRGGSFSGAVDLTIEGASSGVTATLSTAVLAASGTSATVSVQVSATSAVGTSTLTVRGRGTGVSDATASLALTVASAPPPPPAGSITLTRSGGIAIEQGRSGTATLTLARAGGFSGAVELTAEGIPTGITVSIAPTSVAANATGATVTVTAASNAPVGTDGVTIRARGAGVSDATVLIPVTVSAPVGSFSLAVSPVAATVVAGQSVAVTVTVTRVNGFAGPVTLTSAVPAGVTAAFAPATVSGTTSVLTLTAAATATPGTFTVGIGGTGTGVAPASTEVPLTITAASPPPPSGGDIAWTYCGTERPSFFAVQDGAGAWTAVTAGTDGVFRFSVTQARGGVATVQGNGTANTLNVYYLSRDEIVTFGRQFCDDPTSRSVTGTISGASPTDLVYIGFGTRATTVVPSQTTAWTLANVLGGSRDLLATRSALTLSGLNVSYTLSNIILRRGITASGASAQPVLNFGATEAFAPASANLTLANGSGEFFSLITQFTTAAGTSAPVTLDVAPSATTARTWRGVPSSRMQTGDYHTLIASATPSTQSSLVGRQVTVYSTAVADRTLTFGPALATVTTTSLSGLAPRFRSQYGIQSAYDRFYVAQYQQASNGRIHQVQVSRTYLQGGSSYDITTPDLTGVSGWQSAFGLASGVPVTWTFAAQGWFGGTTLSNVGDGNTVLSATTGGQITP